MAAHAMEPYMLH